MKTILLTLTVISMSSCLKNDWKCNCTISSTSESPNGPRYVTSYNTSTTIKKTTKTKAAKECTSSKAVSNQGNSIVTNEKNCELN